MGIFGGRSKESLLIEGFCKVAGEQGYIEKLLCLEAGANEDDILRDTDYAIMGSEGASEFKDCKQVYFGALVYLVGRIAWFGEWVYGANLAELFSRDELKDISEDTAPAAIMSKWSKICDDPDTFISPDYGPNFIYYDQIENARILTSDGERKLNVRMTSGFIYKTNLESRHPVQGARSKLLNRDDIRFLNARIAERNLRN